MNLRPSLRTACALMLAICGAGALHAQSTGFSADAKLRYGYTPSPKDHLYNSSWGGGIGLVYGFGTGKLGLELGYHYKGGDLYIEPIQTQIPAGMQPIEPDPGKVGGDARRNKLDGISARFSWQARLTDDWEWQVGLMLGGSKFKQEYHGDIASAHWSDSPQPSNSWRDFYYGTPTKQSITPSPYGGVSWNIDTESSLEFNVLLMSYKAINYVHYTGAATYGGAHLGRVFPLDSIAQKNRLVPELEIAYVLHL